MLYRTTDVLGCPSAEVRKLTKFLGVDKSFNNLSVYEKKHGLWVEGRERDDLKILKSKRLGVDYAREYRDRLWNFKASPFRS